MRQNRTYPLYFLFVLVTVCAVAVTMLTHVLPALASAGPRTTIKTLITGGVAGAVLGMIMGAYRIDRGMGILVCANLGLVIGGLVTLLFHVDADAFPRLIASQVGGAVLIVFLAALLRFGIRNETE